MVFSSAVGITSMILREVGYLCSEAGHFRAGHEVVAVLVVQVASADVWWEIFSPKVV